MFRLDPADAPIPVRHDAMVQFDEREFIELGRTARVEVLPLEPSSWQRVRVGDRLELFEALRPVGELFVEHIEP